MNELAECCPRKERFKFWEIIMAPKSKFKMTFRLLAAAIIILVTLAVIWGMRRGILSSQETFVSFIESTGSFAPIAFLLIETVSVVVLILPCAFGYPVAAVAFGPFWGFILNAIATIAGSIIIFAIVRQWGQPLADAAVKRKNLKKYERFMNNTKAFEKILAGVLLVPFLPDNVLCYIAGLTKMKFRRVVAIVILFKPWKILFYTYGSDFFIDKFGHLWGAACQMVDKFII